MPLDIEAHVFAGEQDWQPGDEPLFVGTVCDWFDAHPKGMRFDTACEIAERLGYHMLVCFGGENGVPVVKFIGEATLRLMALSVQCQLASARPA